MGKKKKGATLDSIRVNVKAEKEGVWKKIAGVWWLLAKLNNPEHEARQRELYREREDRGEFNSDRKEGNFQDELLGISREAMPGTVIKGWRENHDERGKPIEYSEEKCLEYCTDPGYRLLMEKIEAIAGRGTTYLEAAVGNSSPSSAGGRTEAWSARVPGGHGSGCWRT